MVDHFGPRQLGENLPSAWVDRYSRLFAPGFTRNAFSEPEQLRVKVGPMMPYMIATWASLTIETLEKLKKIPAERRFVIYTRNINSSIDKLAEFAGVPVSTLVRENAHLNRDKNPDLIYNTFTGKYIKSITAPWQIRVDKKFQELAGIN